MMNITIHPSVFSEFNENFSVGILYCTDIDNSESPVDIHEMLRDIEEYTRLNFTKDTAKTHHLISAWNAAIAHYGEKFHHYHTNVERLMQQVLDGDEIASSTKIIDLINFFSLKYLVPMGALDASKLASPEFKVAKTSSSTNEEKFELILTDKEKILAHQLNYDVDKKVMPHEDTKTALIYIEALPPTSKAQLEKIMDEIAALIRVFCSGKIKKAVINKENKKASL
ncbi:MAG TPA: phenylalanine--tRNA ligase beta subunit-related protein [Candidatus Nanoarchaeia archaeon]|nr:phenylalanine--tRNA ligase beta subunit-related protein [Candidatus Nanoarchaeia archaeon]